MEATAYTLATHLENIGNVLSSAIDWVGSCGNMIVSTPLLLVPCVMSVGLIGLGVIKRFI